MNSSAGILQARDKVDCVTSPTCSQEQEGLYGGDASEASDRQRQQWTQSCQSVGSEDLTVSRNDSNDTLSVENKLTRLSYVLLF